MDAMARAAFVKGQQRRQAVYELVKEGKTPREACDQVGIQFTTYEKWRSRFREFAAKIDAVRMDGIDAKDYIRTVEHKMNFAAFRQKYFGHSSPWHHMLMIDALETTKPGSITLINIFPESGKTTTLEDYCTMKLAYDPNARITVGSEAQPHARKFLRRIKLRMDPRGPTRQYVKDFGPFQPPQGGTRGDRTQPWGADFFDVYKRKQHDERDYSMVALGFGSAIAGTRTDLLVGDDLISRKNVGQSEKLVEDFRQDWLTRPGETGRTVIIGTRVDMDDFYELLVDAEIVDRHILIPAIQQNDKGEEESIWPEKWSLEALHRMEKKVGPDAWARNYMQNPRARGDATFSQEIIDKCKNPLRSVDHQPEDGAIVYLGLDPALGSINAIVAVQNDYRAGKLRILDLQTDRGFSRNEQILQRVEEMVWKFKKGSTQVTDVIIEAMNFQKGLAQDERLQEMTYRHGFRVREHLTGVNKYDENIGVASMALSFMREEVEIPWSEDPNTQFKMQLLERELLAWRPKARGSKLRQDLVMALWFSWIHWRQQRAGSLVDPGQFTFKGSPFSLTPSGLALLKSRPRTPARL